MLRLKPFIGPKAVLNLLETPEKSTGLF